LSGDSGNDVLTIVAGAGQLDGGDGADTLTGNASFDALHGGAGTDWLFSGGGADTLNGGDGADFIDAGPGGDIVFYEKTGDRDDIRGFTAGANAGDLIWLLGFGTAFDTFAEVLAAATDDGLHTTINFGGGDVIVLRGVLVSQLAADDFIFG
jgi:Ca2+-binding RTX toxin-like protein